MPDTHTLTTNTHTLTIGTDLEYTIVDKKGNLRSAKDLIKLRRGTRQNVHFGYDGNNETGEIRVKPADNPGDLLKNVKKLLEASKKKYPQVFNNKMVVNDQRQSVGGHIHFGHPFLLNSKPEKRKAYTPRIIKNLDNLLAIPSMFFEDDEYSKWRKQSMGYGKLGDVRYQDWGIEYRTLPSFLNSRELTEVIFYVSYSITHASIFDNFECRPVSDNERILQSTHIHQVRDLLKHSLDTSFKQLISLPKYKQPKYKTNTDRFIKLVMNEKNLYKTEIKEGWKIKFNIQDFYNLDRIETLLDKVLKILIDVHSGKSKTKSQATLVSGNYKDLGCVEIARAVNNALSNSISENVFENESIQGARILGLKSKRGNRIFINMNGFDAEAQKQLLGYCWEIASKIKHKTKIERIEFNSKLPENTIGLGRKIREENLYLGEAIVILTILLRNRNLFKTIDKKRKLKVTKSKILKPIVSTSKKIDPENFKVKSPLNKYIFEGIEIKFPPIIDLNQSYNDNIAKSSEGLSPGDFSNLKQKMMDMARELERLDYANPKYNCGMNNVCWTSEKKPRKEEPIRTLCLYHVYKAVRDWVYYFGSSTHANNFSRLNFSSFPSRRGDPSDILLENSCTICNETLCNICNRCPNCMSCVCEECNNCGDVYSGDTCPDCVYCEECGLHYDEVCPNCDVCFACCTCHGQR